MKDNKLDRVSDKTKTAETHTNKHKYFGLPDAIPCHTTVQCWHIVTASEGITASVERL